MYALLGLRLTLLPPPPLRSNNPLIMSRDWFNEKIRTVAFEGENAFTVNAFFEFNVMLAWLAFRPPAKVCVSYKGIFAHHEVDQ